MNVSFGIKLRSVFLLLACSLATLCAEVVEEPIEYSGVKFRVVRLDPKQIKLVWNDEAGQPYQTFDRVQAAFAKQGKTVKFIMNAGIFEPGGIPSGLHIENGNQLRPINLADAPGNFFLKPNGVCVFIHGKPFIGTCPSWQNLSNGKEIWGIQSGPLLLIAGQRHPAFTQDSKSKLHRNGVGVDSKGRLVFAITDKEQLVNFWDFAGLFLKLDCKNALFLDGDISQMSVNPDKPVSSNRFGAMFVVAE